MLIHTLLHILSKLETNNAIAFSLSDDYNKNKPCLAEPGLLLLKNIITIFHNRNEGSNKSNSILPLHENKQT